MTCTWPKPSRNADVRCGFPGVATWMTTDGSRVVRCSKHYREAAADAARALGWQVINITEEGTDAHTD